MDHVVPIQEVKLIIRGLLVSSPRVMTVGQLRSDYRDQEGQDIPFHEYGYHNVIEFLKSLPDTCLIDHKYDGSMTIVRPVLTEKSSHIDSLVTRSKSSCRGKKRKKCGANAPFPPQLRGPAGRQRGHGRRTPSCAPHLNDKSHGAFSQIPVQQNRTLSSSDPYVPGPRRPTAPVSDNATAKYFTSQDLENADGYMSEQTSECYQSVSGDLPSSVRSTSRHELLTTCSVASSIAQNVDDHAPPMESAHSSQTASHFSLDSDASGKESTHNSQTLSHLSLDDYASAKESTCNSQARNHFNSPVRNRVVLNPEAPVFEKSNAYYPPPPADYYDNLTRHNVDYDGYDCSKLDVCEFDGGEFDDGEFDDSEFDDCGSCTLPVVDILPEQAFFLISKIIQDHSQGLSLNELRLKLIHALEENCISGRVPVNLEEICQNLPGVSVHGGYVYHDVIPEYSESNVVEPCELVPEETKSLSDNSESELEGVELLDSVGPVTLNLLVMLRKNRDGILIKDLPSRYKNMFGAPLNIKRSLGLKSIYELAINRPDLFEIRANETGEGIIALVLSSAQMRETVVARRNISWLLNCYPGGLKASELLATYMARYNNTLNLADLGFPSQKAFLEYLKQERVVLLRVRNDEIWLFPSGRRDLEDEPIPLPETREEMISKMELLFPKDVVGPGLAVPQVTLHPKAQPGEFVEVQLGQVNNPSNFYVYFRDVEYGVALQSLMDELAVFYLSDSRTAYKVPPQAVMRGLDCVTIYRNEFHRARITKILNEEEVEMFFYDYGTVCAIRKEALFFLHNDFAALPAQAIKSVLHNIGPVGDVWTAEASARFLALAEGKGLVGHVIDVDTQNKVLSLILVDTNDSQRDVDINVTLVTEGFARFLNKKEQQQQQQQKTSAVEETHEVKIQELSDAEVDFSVSGAHDSVAHPLQSEYVPARGDSASSNPVPSVFDDTCNELPHNEVVSAEDELNSNTLLPLLKLRKPFMPPPGFENVACAKATVEEGKIPISEADTSKQMVQVDLNPQVAQQMVQMNPNPQVTQQTFQMKPDPQVTQQTVQMNPNPQVTQQTVQMNPNPQVTQQTVQMNPNPQVTPGVERSEPIPRNNWSASSTSSNYPYTASTQDDSVRYWEQVPLISASDVLPPPNPPMSCAPAMWNQPYGMLVLPVMNPINQLVSSARINWPMPYQSPTEVYNLMLIEQQISNQAAYFSGVMASQQYKQFQPVVPMAPPGLSNVAPPGHSNVTPPGLLNMAPPGLSDAASPGLSNAAPPVLLNVAPCVPSGLSGQGCNPWPQSVSVSAQQQMRSPTIGIDTQDTGLGVGCRTASAQSPTEPVCRKVCDTSVQVDLAAEPVGIQSREESKEEKSGKEETEKKVEVAQISEVGEEEEMGLKVSQNLRTKNNEVLNHPKSGNEESVPVVNSLGKNEGEKFHRGEYSSTNNSQGPGMKEEHCRCREMENENKTKVDLDTLGKATPHASNKPHCIVDTGKLKYDHKVNKTDFSDDIVSEQQVYKEGQMVKGDKFADVANTFVSGVIEKDDKSDHKEAYKGVESNKKYQWSLSPGLLQGEDSVVREAKSEKCSLDFGARGESYICREMLGSEVPEVTDGAVDTSVVNGVELLKGSSTEEDTDDWVSACQSEVELENDNLEVSKTPTRNVEEAKPESTDAEELVESLESSVRTFTGEPMTSVSSVTQETFSDELTRSVSSEEQKMFTDEATTSFSSVKQKTFWDESVTSVCYVKQKIFWDEPVASVSPLEKKTLSVEPMTSVSCEKQITLPDEPVAYFSPLEKKTLSVEPMTSVSCEKQITLPDEPVASVFPLEKKTLSVEPMTSVSCEKQITLPDEPVASFSPLEKKTLSVEPMTSVSCEKQITLPDEPVASFSPLEKKTLSVEPMTSVSCEKQITLPDEPVASVSPLEKKTLSFEPITSVSCEKQIALPDEPVASVSPVEKKTLSVEPVTSVSCEKQITLPDEPVASFSPVEKKTLSVEPMTSVSREKQITLPDEPVASFSPLEKKTLSVEPMTSVSCEKQITLPDEPVASVSPLEKKTLSVEPMTSVFCEKQNTHPDEPMAFISPVKQKTALDESVITVSSVNQKIFWDEPVASVTPVKKETFLVEPMTSVSFVKQESSSGELTTFLSSGKQKTFTGEPMTSISSVKQETFLHEPAKVESWPRMTSSEVGMSLEPGKVGKFTKQKLEALEALGLSDRLFNRVWGKPEGTYTAAERAVASKAKVHAWLRGNNTYAESADGFNEINLEDHNAEKLYRKQKYGNRVCSDDVVKFSKITPRPNSSEKVDSHISPVEDRSRMLAPTACPPDWQKGCASQMHQIAEEIDQRRGDDALNSRSMGAALMPGAAEPTSMISTHSKPQLMYISEQSESRPVQAQQTSAAAASRLKVKGRKLRTKSVVPLASPVNEIDFMGKKIYVIDFDDHPYVLTHELIQKFTKFNGIPVVMRILNARDAAIPFCDVSRELRPDLFEHIDTSSIWRTYSSLKRDSIHLIPLRSVPPLMKMLLVEGPFSSVVESVFRDFGAARGKY